jgi:hypothetical protein
MLAIVNNIQEWKTIILNVQYANQQNPPLEIYTDHQSLLYFSEAHKLTYHHACWLAMLMEINKVYHSIKGKENLRADALSCMFDEDTSQDNTDLTLINPSTIINTWMIVDEFDQDRIEEILQQHHDHPLAGHPGIRNTYEKIQQYFRWPHM